MRFRAGAVCGGLLHVFKEKCLSKQKLRCAGDIGYGPAYETHLSQGSRTSRSRTVCVLAVRSLVPRIPVPVLIWRGNFMTLYCGPNRYTAPLIAAPLPVSASFGEPVVIPVSAPPSAFAPTASCPPLTATLLPNWSPVSVLDALR